MIRMSKRTLNETLMAIMKVARMLNFRIKMELTHKVMTVTTAALKMIFTAAIQMMLGLTTKGSRKL